MGMLVEGGKRWTSITCGMSDVASRAREGFAKIGQSSMKMWHLCGDLEGSGGNAMWMSQRRVFQGEGRERTKALRRKGFGLLRNSRTNMPGEWWGRTKEGAGKDFMDLGSHVEALGFDSGGYRMSPGILSRALPWCEVGCNRIPPAATESRLWE